jgi:hypothetical protein
MGASATRPLARSLLSRVLARELERTEDVQEDTLLICLDKQGLSHDIAFEARRNAPGHAGADPSPKTQILIVKESTRARACPAPPMKWTK